MQRVVIFLFLVLPAWVWATSTSGSTTRNVLIDGVVTIGAAAGTNGVNWETDEVFEGFGSIVNWYVSWDDQNLYVGRIGGNNNEGSVIYLRAEYPTFTTTNRGFDYDSLAPEFSPMGGVNFAAYMKNGYDEFRSFSGGVWGAANTSLSPVLSTVGPNDHMEVAIPWNAITNSNGKPSNIRLTLYMIAPLAGAPACQPVARHFVYGESPWGTGNIGDGPSAGVNDGIQTSIRQPGGCGVGQDTATRWWGCYPVIGGVGSNGWTALAPSAGPDTTICELATSFFMLGNNPPAEALGTWTLISQPAGANALIVNVNDPNSLVQQMTEVGSYIFVWDINYGGCPAQGDTVVINLQALPPTANAGPDQTLTCDLNNASLSGNAPGAFGGSWTMVSGQSSIVTPTNEFTTVTNIGPGYNIFVWNIAGGVCPATTDTVAILTFQSLFAEAGPNQELCQASLTTMAADNPALSQATATGQWLQYSGPSSVIFTNNIDPSSNVSNLLNGSYQFVWTVTNGNCPVTTDTVSIEVFAGPIADAGPDRSYCALQNILLDANNPAGLGNTASGHWSQLSGPSTAVFSDSTLYNSAVGNLVDGIYKFVWSMANGTCPTSTDVVTIVVTSLSDDGLDSLRNPILGQFDGYVEVAEPTTGTPPYLYALDGGAFQSNRDFSSLGPGTYTVTIADGNGCTDSLSFVLTEYSPPPLPENDTLFIPDGFSPNADGVNDTWEILGIENYPEAVIEIYNIWGGQIFVSKGAYSPWNGTFQGKDMPQANYYYIVDLKSPAHPVYRGSVTLFR